jgi:hypothetical protein
MPATPKARTNRSSRKIRRLRAPWSVVGTPNGGDTTISSRSNQACRGNESVRSAAHRIANSTQNANQTIQFRATPMAWASGLKARSSNTRAGMTRSARRATGNSRPFAMRWSRDCDMPVIRRNLTSTQATVEMFGLFNERFDGTPL